MEEPFDSTVWLEGCSEDYCPQIAFFPQHWIWIFLRLTIRALGVSCHNAESLQESHFRLQVLLSSLKAGFSGCFLAWLLLIQSGTLKRLSHQRWMKVKDRPQAIAWKVQTSLRPQMDRSYNVQTVAIWFIILFDHIVLQNVPLSKHI